MKRLTLSWASARGVAFAAALVPAFGACRSDAPPTAPASAADGHDLPGIDTADFTPREKHELGRYLSEFAPPCRSAGASISECLQQKGDCPACRPAAVAIARAVREGMAREQVEALYKQRFDPSAAHAIPVDGSPSRGPAEAKATLVEFADFECPFCQRIAPDLDAAWEKRKADVRFVFKFMPLAMHPHGEISARAAIAAQAQGKFWEMHRQLFASGGRLEPSDLESYAKAIGLDVDRFNADLHSPATQERLDADRKLADTLGVQGTPTLYVDGREVDLKSDVGQRLDDDIVAATSRNGP